MRPSPATEAQHFAANPQTSTWLSANAGSGKTKVLTDRVARLLLQGVSPQHILCLTYTKAAASEMQNRLFGELGTWAMKPEADLRLALQALGEAGHLDQTALARARQLFARAIESPGGLRIQTIHSFCATLLRRFPLEAGVSPAFTEMDDRAARILREEIIEEMADGLAQAQVAGVARHHSGNDFLELMEAVTSAADGFAKPLDLAGAKRVFGLGSNVTDDAVSAQVFLGSEDRLITDLLPYLGAGSTNDKKAFTVLNGVDISLQNSSLMPLLESVFLFGKSAKENGPFSAKIGVFPTKATQGKLPDALKSQLEALMLRVEAARPARIALAAAHKTFALHDFAARFLPLYRAAKDARGLLDFDDLIARTIHLLTDRSVAAWVLFRLDGGIEHVLVDEAQDTSPKQWQVIDKLTDDFTSGASANSAQRTLFVVGDKKQSIYSFQGADVAIYDEKRRSFQTKFDAANLPFQGAELLYSFRSSTAVLTVVDNIFGHRFPNAMGGVVQHLAYHTGMAGRVDLWPAIAPAEAAEAIDPLETSARVAAYSAEWELAEKLAQSIKTLLDSGAHIATKNGNRQAAAGDVLILVRRRSPLFHHIIRACKRLHLPIAGADRLQLGAELAVKDLTALLSFLATPEDDLALAAVLRSPLFGISEAALFDLAYDRGGYLWEVLRASPDHSAVMQVLTDLRDQTDFLRPYNLLERMLTRHDGRRRLIARLGIEAEEGIDEMLSQALIYEQGEIPSLTGFLLWLTVDEVTIKRQADSGGNLIRVMTVHGAKGLEAPIVYLPDCANRTPQDRSVIAHLDDDTPVWRMNDDERPAVLAAARATTAEARADEDLRLLYVALTRAQSWLIVAAAGKVSGAESWYQLVQQGMEAAGSVPLQGGGLRHAYGDWPQDVTPPSPAAGAGAGDDTVLPTWTQYKVDPAPRPALPFSPSQLSGAKTMQAAGEGDADAMTRGTAVHVLLEHLPNVPADAWPDLAAQLVPAPMTQSALAEAARVLTNPALAHVFTGGLAEVSLFAPLEKGPMLGMIDRLLVGETRVLAVDFKTNADVPARAADIPAGLAAQMGAYAEALAQIYPSRTIEVAILWTKTADLMRLDHDMMREALRRAAIS